jgi:hypothetical protein
MTSLLQPSYALTLGSQLWTEQLLSLRVELFPAPLLDVVTARLPALAEPDAAVGDPALLSLDGGEGESDVISGTIASMRRGFSELTVTVLDGGGTLAAYRPASTFENVTAGTLITSLCADVGVTTGDVEDGPMLTFYVADPARTALEHVARLAEWSGALARFTPEGELEAIVVNGAEPELALRYGRELLSFDDEELDAPIESFVVAGEAGVGDASAPEALRPTTDFFAGNRPDGPSATAVWRFEPALRTASSAQAASASLQRLYNSGRRRTSMQTTLLPALRPGMVLEIQELPDGLGGGPSWTESVEHRLSPAGATTRARLSQGGAAFDPSSLLGSLAGAVGGLL